MKQNIFQVVPLVNASFFQKLFKQLPIENSVIEVNNLLASYQINEISKENIYEIKQRYQISLEQEFKLNLEEFYAVYLNHCLNDGVLNDLNFENLNHLKLILSLKNDSIEKLTHKIGEIVYRRFFEKAISNGRLIKREEDFLEKIEKDLQLPKSLINNISNETKHNFGLNYVENVIRNLELSPDIEREINNIAESLNVDLLFSHEITEQLKKLKLYWKLEHFPLSTITSDIVIQKSEQCYFKIDSAKWYEVKSLLQKPSHYNSNIRELKSFYLKSISQKRDSYTYKYIDSGSLYLTNKRIIFTGRQKDINIRFEKILRLSPQSDGVEIDKETIKSAFIQFSDKADEFCFILDKLIRERE
ncbi:hypothetical protein [Flavobacterium sp. N1736]|uniref:hypothetical protein n=1 Tax=Flavobacterium sp. N1736 TaxID=2986823 RepID=UPI0022250028|nr:hypothetical protein [Flavobacterium sp. N1736]